jgi:tetratricopeptide (TPR) repeat protein
VAFDDQVPLIYSNLGSAYITLHDYFKAIPVYEKALDLYSEWNSKPIDAVAYYWLGYTYHKTGQFKKEKKLYKIAEQDFPENPVMIFRQAVLSLTQTDMVMANRYIEKYTFILRENSASEADISTGLAGIYSEAGILDKAEEYYREALSLEPEVTGRVINLAWFLIDKDRNVSEGLELVERVLKSQPDNYSYLDCKGWGLYKKGKYPEAVEMLQKSWDLRRAKAVYNHDAFLHLEAAKKAVASQKNN